MTTKQLIVNADDFGLSKGISDAILIAHRHGFLTSTSLMANMECSEYAVQLAARAPRLGIGIHLNICEGRPLSPTSQVRSLVDNVGNFWRAPEMISKLLRWQVSGREIEVEFRAQISWMKQRGLHPTHADSHHHTHIYPAAVLPFMRALKAQGIECVRASRFNCALTNERGRLRRPGSSLRRAGVDWYRALLQAIFMAGFTSPGRRIALLIRDGQTRNRVRAQWEAAFKSLKQGTFELTCHPGLFDPEFSFTDRIRAQREEELHCLIDPALRIALAQNQIALISYHELSGRTVLNAPAERAVAS